MFCKSQPRWQPTYSKSVSFWQPPREEKKKKEKKKENPSNLTLDSNTPVVGKEGGITILHAFSHSPYRGVVQDGRLLTGHGWSKILLRLRKTPRAAWWLCPRRIHDRWLSADVDTRWTPVILKVQNNLGTFFVIFFLPSCFCMDEQKFFFSFFSFLLDLKSPHFWWSFASGASRSGSPSHVVLLSAQKKARRVWTWNNTSTSFWSICTSRFWKINKNKKKKEEKHCMGVDSSHQSWVVLNQPGRIFLLDSVFGPQFSSGRRYREILSLH